MTQNSQDHSLSFFVRWFQSSGSGSILYPWQQHRQADIWHSTLHLGLAIKMHLSLSTSQSKASFSAPWTAFHTFSGSGWPESRFSHNSGSEWGVSVGGSLSLLLHETTAIYRIFWPQLKSTATTYNNNYNLSAQFKQMQNLRHPLLFWEHNRFFTTRGGVF